MRSLGLTSLIGTLLLSLLACRQPSAELQLPNDRAAEPSGLSGPSVIVEAPRAQQSALLLDWTKVDGNLASLVEGQRLRVDYDASHPWAGAELPLVTIVVFGDYECPFCGRLDETLDTLLSRYAGQLRVVYRQFPLPMHRNARFAAALALAAHDRGIFGSLHGWLFDNRKQLDRASVSARLRELGLDPQLVLNEIDSGIYDARIDEDMRLGSHFGVDGTPAYFINGREGSGAKPIEELERTIDEELALADRLLAAGSPREQVWARIMAASSPSLPPPPPEPRFATNLAGLPQRGASKARVEVLMCGDFDCPYCARASATIEQLLQSHPNDVALFFRNQPLPMHPNARAASRAAVAADKQGKFWPMFDLLFADGKKRSDAELADMAKQAGLDVKRFKKDFADPATDKRIDAELAFCEHDLGATGTPTFFVNGRKLVGAQPLEKFEAIVQEELTGRGPP